jgi:FKBP-type peptidyl-prolyl cis-trans isomerase
MPRQPLRSFFVLLLLGVLLLTLAIVVRSGLLELKTNDEPINAAMRQALSRERPQYSTDEAQLIDRLFFNASTEKSGLKFMVRQPGHGPKPQVGQEVSIYFAGRFLDGTQFESTYESGVPLTFKVGVGAIVVKGMDDAVLDMRKGEKRTLIVPWWLGYGEKGKPPEIPPKATLIYEVELVDFK